MSKKFPFLIIQQKQHFIWNFMCLNFILETLNERQKLQSRICNSKKMCISFKAGGEKNNKIPGALTLPQDNSITGWLAYIWHIVCLLLFIMRSRGARGRPQRLLFRNLLRYCLFYYLKITSALVAVIGCLNILQLLRCLAVYQHHLQRIDRYLPLICAKGDERIYLLVFIGTRMWERATAGSTFSSRTLIQCLEFIQIIFIG